jgi:uncharacterized membrane protein SirB2
MYLILKNFHMILATLAICGFLLRGYWLLSGSSLADSRASKTVPHTIDAIFFCSGVWLIVESNLAWAQQTWLLAKFAGLLGYIGFGMVAFRFGKSPEIRMIAFVAAVASFAFIVGAAITKSPMSWLAI